MRGAPWIAPLAFLGPCAVAALGQDFAGPSPPLADPAPLELLERALPPALPALSLTGLTIRWHGMDELVTRSVALGAAWRSARLGVGISQTGAADVGWQALGIALGAVGGGMGMGVRACSRMPASSPSSDRAGIEVGAGGWATLSERFQLWAAVPQAFTDGAPPPLERWLEVGASARIGDTRLWLARTLVPGVPRGAGSEHTVGMALSFGGQTLWAELRDRPLRGHLGIEARAGILGIAATVESHPVLDETIRLRLLVGRTEP